jgi:extracellular factor (EF) 3-hydroxypalmitic acid methyl ester biosynthesis protein
VLPSFSGVRFQFHWTVWGVRAGYSETSWHLIMYSQTQIDPMVSFSNSQGDLVRATIMNLQRKSLVMEVYNPYSIVQVSEVLHDLTVRLNGKKAYVGKAVVISIMNTGLTAIVSATLIDEWRELSEIVVVPGSVGEQARVFVQNWEMRFQIRRDYQLVVNEMRAFLSDVSHWVEQVDLSASLPKEDGRLRKDVFYELADPLIVKIRSYFDALNFEASRVEPEQTSAHSVFAQAALHPLLLRAPFAFRAYTKPLGYAGDYKMVNQLLDDPRQGPSTYFQIVNAAFLQTTVASAHRNRIGVLVAYLSRLADAAKDAGRPLRILNVGCGPAVEVQRFLQNYPNPELLSFELLDFSEETLAWTRKRLDAIGDGLVKRPTITYVQDSVHQLIKRRIDRNAENSHEFDAVYCAGLFDYLSDKVCMKLLNHFATRIRSGGSLLFTNVHSVNPERLSMEHLLEWYLIYRDEDAMAAFSSELTRDYRVWSDQTGVNVFAELMIA